MAPEAIETPREMGLSADIWSVGKMMFQLLTGEYPFGSGLKAVTQITNATPPTFPPFVLGNPQFAPLSQTIVDLILACLKKNPAGRPTADELVERCGKLYYPTMDRQFGVVREIKFDSWGFIKVGGQDVFFNHDSVYGEKPKVGDHVLLSKFVGGGAPRAHPVLKLRK